MIGAGVGAASDEFLWKTGPRAGLEVRHDRLWSIILAGGDGERVRPLVERWLRRRTPKQYCAFVGNRSMLEHTLSRADQLAPRARQVTVVTRAHLADARPQLRNRPRDTVIVQPANRDTAAGVFLPLTYIRARDPQATVVLYPSDHFVHPEERFIEVVSSAVQAAERMPGRLVLLAVAPDRAEPEYGWIYPAAAISRVNGSEIRRVGAFIEKPKPKDAGALFQQGGLWNTMVVASRLDTLWALGWRSFPDVMRLFEQLGNAIGTAEEGPILETIYRVMPRCNFSADLLARCTEDAAVIELDGVLWSDWGRPERIVESLRAIGRKPAFPLECLADAYSQPLAVELRAREAGAAALVEVDRGAA